MGFLIMCLTLSQVVMYGSVQAAFQHGIMAPFRRPRRDPPPPELQYPQHPPPRIEDRGYLAGGDAPALPIAQQHFLQHQGDNVRLDRNNLHQRRPYRVREDRATIGVETLKAADPLFREDQLDGEQHEEGPEVAENASVESGSEDQEETRVKVERENAAAKKEQQKKRQTESNTLQAEKKPIRKKEEGSAGEPLRDGKADLSQPTELQPSHTDLQVSYFAYLHHTRSD